MELAWTSHRLHREDSRFFNAGPFKGTYASRVPQRRQSVMMFGIWHLPGLGPGLGMMPLFDRDDSQGTLPLQCFTATLAMSHMVQGPVFHGPSADHWIPSNQNAAWKTVDWQMDGMDSTWLTWRFARIGWDIPVGQASLVYCKGVNPAMLRWERSRYYFDLFYRCIYDWNW